jgi:hypothetical protein
LVALLALVGFVIPLAAGSGVAAREVVATERGLSAVAAAQVDQPEPPDQPEQGSTEAAPPAAVDQGGQPEVQAAPAAAPAAEPSAMPSAGTGPAGAGLWGVLIFAPLALAALGCLFLAVHRYRRTA